jgi:hypothetical protein
MMFSAGQQDFDRGENVRFGQALHVDGSEAGADFGDHRVELEILVEDAA